MPIAESMAALLAATLHKKEHRIEPYVRTLALADIGHSEAIIRLVAATNELARVAVEKKKEQDENAKS